jgi:hypothetical protein
VLLHFVPVRAHKEETMTATSHHRGSIDVVVLLLPLLLSVFAQDETTTTTTATRTPEGTYKHLAEQKMSEMCEYLTRWKLDVLSGGGDGSVPVQDLYHGALPERLLFQWCSESSRCRSLYHQEKALNLTLFRALASKELRLRTHTSISDLRLQYLCGGGGGAEESPSLENLDRRLWTLNMLAARSEEPIRCDVNHRLVLNEDTATFRCECLEAHTCDDNLYDTTLFHVLVIILSVLAALFFGVSVHMDSQTLEAFSKINNSPRKLWEVLRNAGV